jgi:beta-1,4-mannosyltransferase
VALAKLLGNDLNEISLIGFNGGDLRSDVSSNPKVKVYYIPNVMEKFLKSFPRFMFLFTAIIRILIQLLLLIYILMVKIPRPNFLILQNPPGIPAIYLARMLTFFRRAKFVIDWHNYGYTILQVNRRNKLLVFVARLYEKFYGPTADIHFCVSEAMKKHLKDNFRIEAVNLPDRAMEGIFKRLDIEDSHNLFQEYFNAKSSNENEVTLKNNDKVEYVVDRPILMLSSTSWTPDEDFNILLNAIIQTEEKLLEYGRTIGRKMRKVIFIITGKGPERDKFMNRVKATNLQIFDIRSIWLKSDDYPKILGSFDIGVCLHYSSSGYDLPMKVVDMFAARLPVMAIEYPTIHELVEDNKNGFLFKDENHLSRLMFDEIKLFNEKGYSEKIDKMRQNLREFSELTWVRQWKEVAMPHIKTKCKI